MKIGIIDADLLDNGTRHPNLALMKISAFQKENGNETDLLEDYMQMYNYDEVYISKVFSFTKTPLNLKESKSIHIGGTGFYKDGGPNLPYEIEHHMPDYHLYDDYINKQIKLGYKKRKFRDYQEYSIGFTTRGCFRKCNFCVNKKYDHAVKHSPVKEFLDLDRPKIYLWDDNFLSYKYWDQILTELEETKKPFQFRQGLDIRLMTEEMAERFINVKYSGDYIFAFDYINQRKIIEEKLKLWKKYVRKTTKLYVLVAYERQDALDIKNAFERIKILMKYGCVPYIMRYEAYKNCKYKGMYIQLARWCNQPQFFKKKSFRQFCEANQFYHKTPGTWCSAYKAMREFEVEQPQIAYEYFDMRFEELREY